MLVGFMRHHPLGEQALEWFGKIQLADAGQRARPEAGVEQVQDRMFDAADILGHREPFPDHLGIKGPVIRLAGKAQEIPAAVDKCIERIGLAPRRLAAFRAVDMFPGGMTLQRISGSFKIDILGQDHRQLAFRHRYRTAIIAMDDRDRRAPVALARNAPVAQPPGGLGLAPAFRLRAVDDILLRLLDRHAVEKGAVHDLARTGPGLVAGKFGSRFLAIGNHALDRQAIFAGKVEIALVMRGHAEYCARAIVHHHEIGDIDGQLPVGIERMGDGQASVETLLFHRFQLGRRGAASLAFFGKGGERGIGSRQLSGQRMVGRQRDETCTENRVRPGRKDLDGRDIVLWLCQCEMELQALRLADPVFLHQPHLFGPCLEIRQAGEQILGKIGDLQKPLAELAFFDLGARAPALAVDHLLVGEHGHVDRVPVDRGFLAIDQTAFEQVDEQRLFLPIIFGVAGRQFAAPVEGKAQRLQLAAHRRDIGSRPFTRMDLLFHRCIFRRHAECVPAHRVQHFKALHPPEPGEHVPHRIVADMAHVDAARGIGKHFQDIAARLTARVVRLEHTRFGPARLPALVRRQWIESLIGHCGPIIWQEKLVGDRTAPQVAGLGEDDLLQLLRGRRLDRRIDPRAVSGNLARCSDAQGIGAQILIEDRDIDFHPLAGILRIYIPVGQDHPAIAVGLGQRHERQGVQRSPPQIAVHANGGDLGSGQIGLRTFLASAGRQQGQSQQASGCRSQEERWFEAGHEALLVAYCADTKSFLQDLFRT